MRLVGWLRGLAEHVALDLTDVVLQAVDDRHVGLHDVQQGRLQHGARPVGHALGMLSSSLRTPDSGAARP